MRILTNVPDKYKMYQSVSGLPFAQRAGSARFALDRRPSADNGTRMETKSVGSYPAASALSMPLTRSHKAGSRVISSIAVTLARAAVTSLSISPSRARSH